MNEIVLRGLEDLKSQFLIITHECEEAKANLTAILLKYAELEEKYNRLSADYLAYLKQEGIDPATFEPEVE